MNKTLPFCLDHFTVAAKDRRHASEILKGLGFVTSDTRKNGTTHFILDNGYVEVGAPPPGGVITWLTNSIPVGEIPRVASYRLSVKGKDAFMVHDTLMKSDVVGVGDVNNPTHQFVRYGDRSGEAGYQTIFIIGQEPFTDVLFGCTTHLNKELEVALPGKFAHVNGAHRIKEVCFLCEDQQTADTAEGNILTVYNAMKEVTDHEYCVDTARILDKAGYEETFGVPCQVAGHFPMVSVTFSGCVLDYVETQAEDWNLPCFEKDGMLYVDARADLGLFLIFES